jgi:hypothetical protein
MPKLKTEAPDNNRLKRSVEDLIFWGLSDRYLAATGRSDSVATGSIRCKQTLSSSQVSRKDCFRLFSGDA